MLSVADWLLAALPYLGISCPYRRRSPDILARRSRSSCTVCWPVLGSQFLVGLLQEEQNKKKNKRYLKLVAFEQWRHRTLLERNSENNEKLSAEKVTCANNRPTKRTSLKQPEPATLVCAFWDALGACLYRLPKDTSIKRNSRFRSEKRPTVGGKLAFK